jgi:hypothetical protein
VGSRSRSDLFEGWGSTTILLTDDLEDLGASGSVVLSPIFNLQGAAVRGKTGDGESLHQPVTTSYHQTQTADVAVTQAESSSPQMA